MFRPRLKRRLAWAGGIAAVVLSFLYLLRWPLLEGLIVDQLRKKVGAALNADLSVASLRGSLVSSVRARNAVLHPRPGSPLRSAEVSSLSVAYGPFGLGELKVTARGLRVHLAPSDRPAAPLQDTIREAVASFESFRFPGTLTIEDGTLILAGGQEIRIDRAWAAEDKAEVRVRTVATGPVEIRARVRSAHSWRLEGKAPEAAISWLRLDLSSSPTAEHPLRLDATVGGESVEWVGTATLGKDGKLDAVRGALQVREGTARTQVDLRSGATEIEVDAPFSLRKRVVAEGVARGRVRGSLGQSLAEWTVWDGFVRVSSAEWKRVRVAGDLEFSRGTLSSLPWRAKLTQGDDRVDAQGSVSWKEGWGLEATFSLEARDLDAYRTLLPETMDVKVRDLHLSGRVDYGKAGPAFEGSLVLGPGQASGVSWESIRWGGQLTPRELVICQLEAKGLPGVPEVLLLGSARLLDTPAGSPVQLDVTLALPRLATSAPVGVLTDVSLHARIDGRGLDVRTLEGRMDHGPFRAIGRWDFRAERKPLRVHLVGENMLVLGGKQERLRITPDVWLEGDDTKGWLLDGTVDVSSAIYFGELGDPQAGREGKVRAAAAPKLKLQPAAGGGFVFPTELEGGERLALDLVLRTTNEARIENSAVGALLEGEFHVGGTLAAPALSGSARTRKGEVKLATGVFIRIERMEVTLPRVPGQSGTIYFRGRSGKGQGAITVVIAGPLEDPALQLSSDPPRKQEELLASLAFGTAPGEVGGGEALGTVASKAFAKATDAWPRAEPREGFWDRFNLTLANEDNPDPDKRVPWQLPPTASARGTIVRTEYLLNSVFSVIVESDREAHVSGDLKVRFHFR